MFERKWKLGEDCFPSDCTLDPVTFDDIILAVRHNSPVPSEKEVLAVAKDIIEGRLEDYWYLVKNNIEEILEAVDRMKRGE